jgi:TolB protein
MVMDADGSSLHDLGPHRHSPAWSPDGREIAFVRGYNEQVAIWISTPEGMAARRIGSGENPLWSPDGKRIVFERIVDDAFTIFLMDADGTNVKRLLGRRQLDDSYAPAWSSTGDRIAFSGVVTSGNGDGDSVYLVKPNGTALRRLVRPVRGTSIGRPEWSPNDRWILFARDDAFHIIGTDGRGLTRIARGDGDFQWSPSGRKVAFDRQASKGRRIYAVRTDGSGLRAISPIMRSVGGFDW